VIRIDIADAVTIHSPHAVLVVRAPLDDPLLPQLTSALDTPGSTFRKLAQAIVENDFDVPPLACVTHGSGGDRIFIFGDIAAHVGGAVHESMIGSGRSTWIEQDLPPDAPILIEVPAQVRNQAVSGDDSVAEAGGTTPGPDDDARHTTRVSESNPEKTRIHTSGLSLEPPSLPPDPNLIGIDSAHTHSPHDARPGHIPTADTAPTQGENVPAADDVASALKPNGDATLDAAMLRGQVAGHPNSADSDTSRPLVTAKVCPCGAANPLTNSSCRTCGLNLRRDGVTIGQAPRPALGFLLFDDGLRHELMAPVIIGRAAPSDYLSGDRLAQAITVASPNKHVSKAHVEIRLIDWTVNVIDLDSANGTYVEGTDGRSPRRLRPNVVEQIASGDVVQFGDRSFTFEAVPGL